MENLEVKLVMNEIIQKISLLEKIEDAHSVTDFFEFFQPHNDTWFSAGNLNDEIEDTYSPKPVSDTSSGFGDSLEEPTATTFYKNRMKIQTSQPEKKLKSCHLFSFSLGHIPVDEKKEEEKFLDDAIDEAIRKYESAEAQFKEVSVQTHFVWGCSSNDKKWFPLEKSRLNKTENPDYNQESLSVNDGKNSWIFETTPRIRVGLSKRAKPQPLHGKIIY